MAEENKYNIKIECGADFVMPYIWRDESGNPVDLTGATIEAQLREYAEDTDYYIFSCTHNDTGGKITISMPHEITATIPFTAGVYDVYVNFSEGGREKVFYGDVAIVPNVVRPVEGTLLYMLGIDEYDDLPETGLIDRVYLCYEDRKIYRWNGTNYIATSVGNGIQRIDYLDGGTYRMVFDDGTYFDFESVPRAMGAHDSTQAYQKLDIVMAANGASYIALVPVPAGTAISNTDYWMQITPKTPTITSEDVSYDYAHGHTDLVTNTGTADAPNYHYKVPRGVTGNESIDDTAGEGDDDVVWSADKTYAELLKAYVFRDSTDYEPDLDEWTDQGIYGLDSSTEYDNNPLTTGQSSAFVLTIREGSGSNYTRQIVLRVSNGECWGRVKSGSPMTWKSWHRFDTPIDDTASDTSHVWSASKLTTEFGNSFICHAISTNTDLNDLYLPGYYHFSSTVELTNKPSFDDVTGSWRTVIILPGDTLGASNYKHQIYMNFSKGILGLRVRTAGSSGRWNAWRQYNLSDINEAYINRDATTYNPDFNDWTDIGIYELASSTEYANNPLTTGQSSAFVLTSRKSSDNYTRQFVIRTTNGECWGRVKSGSPMTWKAWNRLDKIDEVSDLHPGNTQKSEYTPAENESQGQNVGTNLRVMSYNICHFNHDTETYISDTRLFNLNKMFMQVNADIIGLQEDKVTIDSAGTKSSSKYVYYPQYPYKVDYNSENIRAKFNATSSGRLSYTPIVSPIDGTLVTRAARWAVFEFGDKKLLFVSTHPSQHATPNQDEDWIAVREQQYQEIFDWVCGTVTMKDYSTSEDVTVPTHTHCILTGDWNCGFDEDRENLADIAADHDFLLSNGGKLGWMDTCYNTSLGWLKLDNIIVSNNVIINNFEVWKGWYNDLYSDHVPVFADVTLQ